MARRVRLHIGTHKTGTTALQTRLQALVPALAARGWRYLSKGPNHSWLYLLFTEAPHLEHDLVKRGLNSPVAAKAWVAERRAALVEELAGGQEDVLISGEELCRLSANGVEALLRFMAGYFDDVGVVCCVRAPLGYCISEAQEGIKGGLTMAEVSAHPPVARYRSALGAYVERLPPSRVRVLRYEGWRAGGGDGMAARVLAAAGVPVDGVDLADEPQANVALSLEAAEVLSHLNATVPMFVDGAPNPARAPIPAKWLKRVGATPFTLPRESLIRSLEEGRDDLRWLRQLVGEDWFVEDDPVAGPGPAVHGVARGRGVPEQGLLEDVAAVLHDAAALVRDCMTSVLADRVRQAEAAGDPARAARHRADLYHVRPAMEFASR